MGAAYTENIIKYIVGLSPQQLKPLAVADGQ
jgi:hypothetical protein